MLQQFLFAALIFVSTSFVAHAQDSSSTVNRLILKNGVLVDQKGIPVDTKNGFFRLMYRDQLFDVKAVSGKIQMIVEEPSPSTGPTTNSFEFQFEKYEAIIESIHQSPPPMAKSTQLLFQELSGSEASLQEILVKLNSPYYLNLPILRADTLIEAIESARLDLEKVRFQAFGTFLNYWALIPEELRARHIFATALLDNENTLPTLNDWVSKLSMQEQISLTSALMLFPHWSEASWKTIEYLLSNGKTPKRTPFRAIIAAIEGYETDVYDDSTLSARQAAAVVLGTRKHFPDWFWSKIPEWLLTQEIANQLSGSLSEIDKMPNFVVEDIFLKMIKHRHSELIGPLARALSGQSELPQYIVEMIVEDLGLAASDRWSTRVRSLTVLKSVKVVPKEVVNALLKIVVSKKFDAILYIGPFLKSRPELLVHFVEPIKAFLSVNLQYEIENRYSDTYGNKYSIEQRYRNYVEGFSSFLSNLEGNLILDPDWFRQFDDQMKVALRLSHGISPVQILDFIARSPAWPSDANGIIEYSLRTLNGFDIQNAGQQEYRVRLLKSLVGATRVTGLNSDLAVFLKSILENSDDQSKALAFQIIGNSKNWTPSLWKSIDVSIKNINSSYIAEAIDAIQLQDQKSALARKLLMRAGKINLGFGEQLLNNCAILFKVRTVFPDRR